MYSPINPFGQVRRAAPPPAVTSDGALPPPRPVLVLDGREGRPENAPKLTPEYLAKWEVIRQSRMAGSDEFDPNARCLSAGMPNMMGMTYGMEVQHTKDKITMYGELNDVYRRIFLDGRRPSQRVLDDPTFAGYSTGHWEGDTLVVETVAIREDALFNYFSPHSDQFTVTERIGLFRLAFSKIGSRRRIQKRCSSPLPRFVRTVRRPRRTTSCASSRAQDGGHEVGSQSTRRTPADNIDIDADGNIVGLA